MLKPLVLLDVFFSLYPKFFLTKPTVNYFSLGDSCTRFLE